MPALVLTLLLFWCPDGGLDRLGLERESGSNSQKNKHDWSAIRWHRVTPVFGVKIRDSTLTRDEHHGTFHRLECFEKERVVLIHRLISSNFMIHPRSAKQKHFCAHPKCYRP